MGRSTFNAKTDRTQVAKQLQGFAQMLGLEGVEAAFLESAGGLYRVDLRDGSSWFFETENEVTNFLVNQARHHYFVKSFRKDIGKA